MGVTVGSDGRSGTYCATYGDSSHVIATIYKDVTAAQAEGVLWMATHDPTGRIGENVSVSSSSLYLMHLPHDVLGAIPTIVENAGMGEMPRYYSGDPFVTVQEFATAVFDVIVGSLTCLWNMATHLVEIGLRSIGDLTTEFASAVHDAVDAIVDAFSALVDWVIDLVIASVHQVVDPVVSAVEGAIEGYLTNMAAATTTALADIEDDGVLSSSSRDLLDTALDGDLYWIIVGIAISIQVIVLAVTGVTNVFGFVLSMAMTLAASIIIEELFDLEGTGTSLIGEDAGGDPFEDSQVVRGVMEDAGMDTDPFNGEGEFVWALLSAVSTQLGSKLALGGLASLGVLRCYGIMSIVSGLMGATFGMAGSLIDVEPIVEWTLGVTGLAFGLESCLFGLLSIDRVNQFSIGVGIAGVTIGTFALCCSCNSLTFA